ncbi:MAG: hypothetical protein RLZ83_2109, partial [Pseudomonadota bacterium]
MRVTVVGPPTWGLRALKPLVRYAPKMGDQGGALTPRMTNRKDAMKTDSELKKDVLAELEWDPEINAASIGVGVKDGVVTVSGHLDTYAEKFAIERALRRIVGVKALAMEVDVTLAPQHRRSDSEIAAAAADALK